MLFLGQILSRILPTLFGFIDKIRGIDPFIVVIFQSKKAYTKYF